MRTLILWIFLTIPAMAEESVIFQSDLQNPLIERAFASDGGWLGYIDWEEQVIIAYGLGSGASYARNAAQRRAGAQQAARDQAYAHLQIMVQAVRQKAGQPAKYPAMAAQIQDLYTAADGTVTVALQRPLSAMVAVPSP